MKSNKLIAASALAATLMAAAAPAVSGTIQVPDGNGGWKEYVPPPKPPTGPSGISVGDGHGGWRPYIPNASPGPQFAYRNGEGEWVEWKPPARRKLAPRPIRHVKSHGLTYYLMEDRNTGDRFIQIEDANGNSVGAGGSAPMPGGGQSYGIR